MIMGLTPVAVTSPSSNLFFDFHNSMRIKYIAPIPLGS